MSNEKAEVSLLAAGCTHVGFRIGLNRNSGLRPSLVSCSENGNCIKDSPQESRAFEEEEYDRPFIC